MAMSFMRIGGKRIYPPPVLSIVQTDGSFHVRNGSAAVAARITLAGDVQSEHLHPLYNAESVTEAEWASVYFGILMAQKEGLPSIGIENDCMGIVSTTLFGHSNKETAKNYAKYYSRKIRDSANNMEWCGIRWIPRRLNKADKLFRQVYR